MVDSVAMSPAMAIVVPIAPVGCSHCKRQFSTVEAADRHQSRDPLNCRQCKKKFSGVKALQNHQRSTEHCYCSQCEVYLMSMVKHIAHLRDGKHENLYHCCDCERGYSNQETLNYHCCDCDKGFRNSNALIDHINSKAHKHKVELLKLVIEHKCKICKDTFDSKNALKKHNRSKHPVRQIRCPVGENCIKKFKTPSALMNHLESGSCSSGLTRSRIQQLVATHDPERYITSSEALNILETTEVMSQASARYGNLTNFNTQRLTMKVIYPTPTWSSLLSMKMDTHHHTSNLRTTTASVDGLILAGHL